MINPLKSIWRRLRALGQSRAVKQEVDEELRFHLEQRTMDNVARGMAPGDAARAARKQFGNWQTIREECREARGASFGETLWQDVRFSLRMLRKSPGFTLVVILTLALGIGANTAIFSMVNGVLLRPLPYANSGRLVVLRERNMELGFSHFSVAPGTLLDWQAQNHVFESLAATSTADYNLTGMEQPVRVHGLRVTANLFSLLGIQPELGRSFLPQEDAPGQNEVVILSHGFWQDKFGGDPGIVGKQIRLDGTSRTVIGVADVPDGKASLWVPISFTENDRTDQGGHWLTVLGRLKTGVSLQQANAEMDTLAKNLQRQYPDAKRGWTVLIDPAFDVMVGQIRPALLLLFSAVGLVLLIACTNIAGLLLARASGRQREFAIRTAMGAACGRLARQLLTESILLGIGGGLVGLLMATGGLSVLRHFASDNFPRLEEVRLDGTVLGFALVASLATGVIFGLVPALQAGRGDVTEPLKDGGRGISAGRRNFMRTGLVVAEIALSLMLLVDAGLVIKSFIHLTGEPVGYSTSHLLAGDVGLPQTKYKDAQAQSAFFDDLLGRLAASPGVESAGAVSVLPLTGHDCWLDFKIPGRIGPPVSAAYFQVSPNYFHTMQIPLVAGRPFVDQDGNSSAGVAIVNQTFARTFFPNQDVLGKQIEVSDGGPNPREIVGVIKDVKTFSLNGTIPAEMYLPYRQRCWGYFSVVVRTAANPAAAAGLLRSAVLATDPDQPLAEVHTMEELVKDSSASSRFMVILMGAFAGVALLLCATGIYGLISGTVARRTHEFGIRLALGATGANVLCLVLRQGLALALAGLVLGLAGALATTRLLASLLYGVEPRDLTIFALGVAALTTTVVLASFIPARRATRVDPMTALRYE